VKNYALTPGQCPAVHIDDQYKVKQCNERDYKQVIFVLFTLLLMYGSKGKFDLAFKTHTCILENV
ncbi:MAG: hypothetical protein O7D30_09395, partial [Rickettsia endosymbiont of Ixodes persulcatus]|nr:hypothetical protein [Rickettsia endosymbiont of Ixodes persulcatus]